MAVTWRNDFDIGVLEIDGQHREIFARFDRLLAAIDAGKGKEEVVRTLNFLDQYSREHFSKEEALQRRYGYPQYEMHHTEHQHFILTLDAIYQKYVLLGAHEVVVKQTSQALQGWLIKHICSIDRAFAAFLASHPSG